MDGIAAQEQQEREKLENEEKLLVEKFNMLNLSDEIKKAKEELGGPLLDKNENKMLRQRGAAPQGEQSKEVKKEEEEDEEEMIPTSKKNKKKKKKKREVTQDL